MILKPYQETTIRRQVHAALKEAKFVKNSGASYKNAALKSIVGLKPQLSGPEYEYAETS
jgi:hypothetical protein